MINIKPNTVTLDLLTGDIVELLINFSGMALLRQKNKEWYKTLNKVLVNSDENNIDLLEIADVIYYAYVMNNLYSGNENYMSYNNFIRLLPFDLTKLSNAFYKLISGEKKMDFVTPSDVEQVEVIPMSKHLS